MAADESWKELVAESPIIYSKSELLALRAQNKLKWKKYLNILWESKHFKEDVWTFEGCHDFKVTTFEPYHKNEVLDIILYQFSSRGNNTFHKILNTPVGALKPGCVKCLDHICNTGLGYVLLDRYNHVQGVFYGWDLRDEPMWEEDKEHIASIKEDEICEKANKCHSFANNLFGIHKEKVKYGSVFFGEVLCVAPQLMSNGWFTKLSFNICVLFGMEYDVYYDFDFQPSRHLYRPEVFEQVDFLADIILRYDLFYFGDFQFECDDSNIAQQYPILKQKYKFKDVDNWRKNAYVGCFIIRNSEKLKARFNNDFIKVNETVQFIRKAQEALLLQVKRSRDKRRKQKKLKSKL
eukprot:97884_1